jgi:hypothetical protein
LRLAGATVRTAQALASLQKMSQQEFQAFCRSIPTDAQPPGMARHLELMEGSDGSDEAMLKVKVCGRVCVCVRARARALGEYGFFHSVRARVRATLRFVHHA